VLVLKDKNYHIYFTDIENVSEVCLFVVQNLKMEGTFCKIK